MITTRVIGCGWEFIGPATTALTQALKPRPVMRLGRATASVPGRAAGFGRTVRRSLFVAAGATSAAFASGRGVGADSGFPSGLAASAVTTAAPMASASEPAANLETDI